MSDDERATTSERQQRDALAWRKVKPLIANLIDAQGDTKADMRALAALFKAYNELTWSD